MAPSRSPARSTRTISSALRNEAFRSRVHPQADGPADGSSLSLKLTTLRGRLIGSSALAIVVLLVVCFQFLRAFAHQEAVIVRIKEQQITRLEKVGRLMLQLSNNQSQLAALLSDAVEGKVDEAAVFIRGRSAIDAVRSVVSEFNALRPWFDEDAEALSVYGAAERELAAYRGAIFSVVDLCTVDVHLAPVEMLKASGSYVHIVDYMSNVVNLTNSRVAADLDRMQTETKRANAYLLASGAAALLVLVAGSGLFYRDMRRAEVARDLGKAKIDHLAHHDALTGLPNRALFALELDRALARAARGELVALLYLDLDHFKRINDTFGHSVGDELLRQAANRLRGCVRETDIVARLGGDEFAILQTALSRPSDAATLAGRIVENLKSPFVLHDTPAVIGASIGIAIAPDDAKEREELVRNADLALYAAKESGRRTYHFYREELDVRMKMRHQIEADLRIAITDGQFELHFQPIVDLQTDEVKCCEALLRWNHPKRGIVSPADFIPIAEECGLIVALGEWVLREACAAASAWPEKIAVAVNLSPAQVKADALPALVTSALAAAGLAPSRLELEITESVLMQNTFDNLETLHRLRDLGVRISMDDFGTGYSSLSYLRSFPFDKIKIDKSFIDHISEKEDCVTIVQAVTTMAQRLSMTTVAEGVETADQRRKLAELGCTDMQGYLISRPRPAADILRQLRDASAPAESAAA